jgi:hypothetical protein
MVQEVAHPVAPVVEPQEPVDEAEQDGVDEAIPDQSVDDELLERQVNQDPMAEDAAQEEDGIEEPLENDNAWNWQQVPILEATKRTGRQTRLNEAPPTTYIDPIPEFKADPDFPPGPKNIPPNCENELDFFRLFFDDYIMDTFVIIMIYLF